ncbi:MAG: hypothetical protein WA431_08900 [Candidatus Cybelea sp.]
MSIFRLGIRAFRIGLATAFLAGCGAVQSTEPGALPLSSATNTLAKVQEHSWMLPEAKNEDLIYAVGGCGGTCVLSYPGGTIVGNLDTSGSADCSDSKGNVFITGSTSVLEYAHGGTSPINTLKLPGDLALGCSVDPTTGNLAVVFSSSYGDIAVFPNAQGTPVFYNAPINALFCGYDNAGNLFVDGLTGNAPALSELPAGSSVFTNLSLSGITGSPEQVQWDGKHLTYETVIKGNVNVARLSLSDTTAFVVGKTHFKGVTGFASQSWIYKSTVFVPFGTAGQHAITPKIGAWKYPRGGKPQAKYTNFQGSTNFVGVTLSVYS